MDCKSPMSGVRTGGGGAVPFVIIFYGFPLKEREKSTRKFLRLKSMYTYRKCFFRAKNN
jgi:hypothetical protein